MAPVGLRPERLTYTVAVPIARRALGEAVRQISRELGEPIKPSHRSFSIVFGAESSPWERGIHQEGDVNRRTWTAQDPSETFSRLMEDEVRTVGAGVTTNIDHSVTAVEGRIVDDTRLPYALLTLEILVDPSGFSDSSDPGHDVYAYFQATRAAVEALISDERRRGLPAAPAVLQFDFVGDQQHIDTLRTACREHATIESHLQPPDGLQHLREGAEQIAELMPDMLDLRHVTAQSHLIGYRNQHTLVGQFGQAQGSGLHTAFIASFGTSLPPTGPMNFDSALGLRTLIDGPELRSGSLASYLAAYYWLNGYITQVTSLHERIRASVELLDSQNIGDLESALQDELLPLGLGTSTTGIELRAMRRIFLPQAERLGQGRWTFIYDVGVHPPNHPLDLVAQSEPSYLKRISKRTINLITETEAHVDNMAQDHERLIDSLHTIVQQRTNLETRRTNQIVLALTIIIVLLGILDLFVG